MRIYCVMLTIVLFPSILSAADSGNLPWVVLKCATGNVSGSIDSIVADFASEDEASKHALELNHRENSLYTYYTMIKRPTSEAAPGTMSEKIEVPQLPSVDPGSYKRMKSEQEQQKSPDGKGPEAVAQNIEGKIGTGKVGKYGVTIEFRKDNQFAFTKGLDGEGKVEAGKNGTLLLTTQRSMFGGRVADGKFTGLWFVKDNSQKPMAFSFVLHEKLNVAGDWRYTSVNDGYAFSRIITLNTDGRDGDGEQWLPGDSRTVYEDSYSDTEGLVTKKTLLKATGPAKWEGSAVMYVGGKATRGSFKTSEE